MRTNVVLDEELIREAQSLTGVYTKRAVIQLALEELVRSRRKKNLADLAGKVRLRGGFDQKSLRKLRK